MKRARGHASGHPRMSFCVVNVTLLESCVYVLPARGRTVGGACPPSPLSAYPDPLRHARRPGKSGTVVRRVRPVRASTLGHFVFDYLRLPIVTVACSTPGLYRTLPTYRSVGASAMRCGGWRVVTSFTRVTFSFSRALGPRSGRQEPVAFYLLKQSRSRDSSAPAAVRGVAAPASRRAVPCGLRLAL